MDEMTTPTWGETFLRAAMHHLSEAAIARVLEAGWDRALTLPLETLVPRAALRSAMDAHLKPAWVEAVVVPSAKAYLETLNQRMQSSQTPLGAWMSPVARKDLEALVAAEGALDPAWVKAVFEQQLVEDILTDTMLWVLREFAQLVPRLLESLPGLGARFGPLASVSRKLIEELEKRIEPEIKKFLEKRARSALEGATRFACMHIDDDVAKRGRRNLMRFALDQPVSFHWQSVSAPRFETFTRVALELIRNWAASPVTHGVVDQVIDEIYQTFGAKPVQQSLDALGIRARPDFSTLAQVIRPVVLGFADTQAVADWLTEVAQGHSAAGVA
jgi:hypothetical protein